MPKTMCENGRKFPDGVVFSQQFPFYRLGELKISGLISADRVSTSFLPEWVGEFWIKVYEAMAKEMAIVSTRVGDRGVAMEDGKPILLANQPKEFAKSVLRLLRNPIASNELERSAREFVDTRSGWNEEVQRVAEICLGGVNSRQSRLPVQDEMP
jgi:glycosyltransferase involved in cell wall biosynthesis